MGAELLPSRVPGQDAVLAHGAAGSPVSCECHLLCACPQHWLGLAMAEVSAGKVEFERTWCNEELMAFLGGGKKP